MMRMTRGVDYGDVKMKREMQETRDDVGGDQHATTTMSNEGLHQQHEVRSVVKV
jgi:hypothetical protein